MYKLLLILKYLRKRRIAWVSLIAVMLCTAMVLVVISVMGGWLRMFENNFHALSGDILVTARTMDGFPYYDRMATELEKLPEVTAAVPVIQTYGVVNIGNKVTQGVQVIAYPLDQIGKVNRFPQSLYFQYQQYIEKAKEKDVTAEQKAAFLKQAEESAKKASFDYRPLEPASYERPGSRGSEKWPGIVMGVGLLDIRKGKEGTLEGRDLWKYTLPVKLALFNVDVGLRDPDAVRESIYWIADDSRSGVWQFDSNTVYIAFDHAQREMGMDAREVTLSSGATVTKPGRTRELNIKLKDGVDLNKFKAKVQEVVDHVLDEARTQEMKAGSPIWSDAMPKVETWRENKAMWIGAVENEKVLVVGLFAIISLVAVMLILAIFYMIVIEKTRDIGTIRSVGASRIGVAGVFVGYGAAIGIVGSVLGVVAGYLVVHNINMLHQKLGQLMGVQIWKPEVYVFDTIPSQINWSETAVIVAVAVLSSIAGSLVPALRAGSMNPVEALRWE